jgi:hypothetical protein
MNDPHVSVLIYQVRRDETVTYHKASLLEYETTSFKVSVKSRTSRQYGFQAADADFLVGDPNFVHQQSGVRTGGPRELAPRRCDSGARLWSGRRCSLCFLDPGHCGSGGQEGRRRQASSAHNLVVAALESVNLPRSDMTPCVSRASRRRRRLRPRPVDAWSIWDPFLAIAELKQKARALPLDRTISAQNSHSF